jgi:cytochrome c-type biogenesis protein CcmH
VSLVMLAAPSLAGAAPTPVTAVSTKITCQCGCGAVLDNCPHEDCGWGVPARLFIEEQLTSGNSPEQLIQYYESEYGKVVLAAPTKRGFDVTAWVTPFIVIVMGAVGIYYLLRMWAARRESATAPGASVDPPAADADDARMRRFEKELREFD